MDLHKTGLYIVFTPAGTPLHDTFSTTAYSARAQACRAMNRPWQECVKQGYAVYELQKGVKLSCIEDNQPSQPSEPMDPLVALEQDVINWDLFRSNPGWQAAELALSEALKREVRAAYAEDAVGLERAQQIRDRMYLLMDTYTSLGARDTEPELALVNALAKYMPFAASIRR